MDVTSWAAAKKQYAWWAGLLLAAALVALPFDNAAYQLFRGKSGAVGRAIFEFPSEYGRYAIHLVVFLILFASPNVRRLIGGYLSAYGLGLIVVPIKYLVGRARPFAAKGPFYFHPALHSLKDAMNSFPSGDASAAFILFALLGLYFPRSRRYFFVLALWTGLGRVAGGKHFLSDVLAGGAIGIASVLLAMHWLGSNFFDFKTASAAASMTGPRREGGEAVRNSN